VLRLEVGEGRIAADTVVSVSNTRQRKVYSMCNDPQIPEGVTHLLDDACCVSKVRPRVPLLILYLAEQAAGFPEYSEHQNIEALYRCSSDL
jgi:hypothetical protein